MNALLRNLGEGIVLHWGVPHCPFSPWEKVARRAGWPSQHSRLTAMFGRAIER